MARIFLTQTINAPVERVFDLNRSIDLHVRSMGHTKERAVDGVRSGLISLNETVTWEAKHWGRTRRFTSIISSMNRPFEFTDEMVKGDFKSWKHIHRFEQKDTATVVTDEVFYTLPYSLAGKLLNTLFLKRYMTRLLQQRNDLIQQVAESGEWTTLLK